MRKYTIQRCDVEKNKSDVLPILERNLKGLCEERYCWNYQKGPCGTARNWVVKDETKQELVGSDVLFPREIYVQRKLERIAVAGDFAIDKDHRGFGPAIALQKEIRSVTR